VDALQLVDAWDVPNVAIAIVGRGGVEDSRGDASHSFRLASIAKVLAAYCALIAVEEGSVALDDPVGRPGSTLRHVLSHAAGYAFDGPDPIAAVGRRRIYSNTGIELACEHLATRTGLGYSEYLCEAVFAPLGMSSSELRGSAAHAVWSPLDDLTRFAAELLSPRLIDSTTLAEAVKVQFPGLPGILPDVGRFTPLDWGLGFERNFGKPGHWAGTSVSSSAFGHFGGAGTFVIVDPAIDRAIVCLTDREFGPWAKEAWPPLCDAVVAECSGAAA